jgi:hypothetical protein
VLGFIFGLTAIGYADTFEFRLQKQADKWSCTSSNLQEGAGNVRVNVLLTSETPVNAVVLKATVTPSAGGAAVVGNLIKSDAPGGGNLWTLPSTPVIAKATEVALSGTVEMQDIACEKAATTNPQSPQPTPAPVAISRNAFSESDLAAASWLDGDQGQNALRAVRKVVERENPSVSPTDIKLLPHLPSGAKAPSYPTSISERQIAQVVLLVPPNGTNAVDFTLTHCEPIPNYRVSGDIAALQANQVDFKVVRIGNVLSCGADKVEYSMTVRNATAVSEPVTTTLPVRPVYNLAPLATFGFDMTSQSTFQVRDGKIAESVDRVGPGLLAGASYFINGVDYADMRWYQHFLNPFVAVSLAAPKDHFVVGTALTYRGGISLALGVGFNHVGILSNGYTVGQPFTGQGDIPQDKVWRRGFYIGVGLDDKLYASFKKLDKGGTGGGTPAAPTDGSKGGAKGGDTTNRIAPDTATAANTAHLDIGRDAARANP